MELRGIGAALLFGAQCASAVTINFENSPVGTLSAGDVLKNQYASQGVVFSAWENGSEVNSIVRNFSGGDLYWVNTTTPSFGPRHDILRMEFASPISGLSLNFFTQSHGSLAITFKAYNSSGTLLETVTAQGSFVSTSFSANGISRIDGLQPNDHWGWGLDDLTFNAAVPDTTGTVALLILAALSLLFVRKFS